MNISRFSYTLIVDILIILSAGYIFGGSYNTANNRIQILVNNITGEEDSDLEQSGGLSVWIEANGKTILFDAGGDYQSLLQNVDKLKLDLGKLDALLISHNHWDHVYGLPGIMKSTGYKPDVYVPEYSYRAIKEQNPRASVIPINIPNQIYPGIWSTGQLSTTIHNTIVYEQSIIIENNDSLYILTGCSHPGIIKIVEIAISMFPEKPIALLAGGFHLRDHSVEDIENISSKLMEMGVKVIAPSHCTGRTAIKYFKEKWRENYKSLGLGEESIF